MTLPELSRPVRVDTLGPEARAMSVEASEAERAALAVRFGYVEIESLSADVALARSNDVVTARGTVRARLTQSCAASGEPVDETVEAPFDVEFRRQPERAGGDEEVELGETEMDVVFYDGALVDVGEAVAETLSLSAASFPRSASADAALREAGVRSEDEAAAEASPFAALSALKRQKEQ